MLRSYGTVAFQSFCFQNWKQHVIMTNMPRCGPIPTFKVTSWPITGTFSVQGIKKSSVCKITRLTRYNLSAAHCTSSGLGNLSCLFFDIENPSESIRFVLWRLVIGGLENESWYPQQWLLISIMMCVQKHHMDMLSGSKTWLSSQGASKAAATQGTADIISETFATNERLLSVKSTWYDDAAITILSR